MAPSKAPLPTPWNLPFQVSLVGIHTSKLIDESGVGVATAATRQNAGSASGAAVAGAPGTAKGPAGVDVAATILTFGSVSAASCPHGVPVPAGGAKAPSRTGRAINAPQRHPKDLDSGTVIKSCTRRSTRRSSA